MKLKNSYLTENICYLKHATRWILLWMHEWFIGFSCEYYKHFHIILFSLCKKGLPLSHPQCTDG